MSEQQLQNEILRMIGASFPDSARAWRNNSGALKDQSGRLVRFGCPGSPDILGIAKGGIWFGIEVKTEMGRMSEAQKNFRNMVLSMGGHYACVRSINEAWDFLHQIIFGISNSGRE